MHLCVSAQKAALSDLPHLPKCKVLLKTQSLVSSGCREEVSPRVLFSF